MEDEEEDVDNGENAKGTAGAEEDKNEEEEGGEA